MRNVLTRMLCLAVASLTTFCLATKSYGLTIDVTKFEDSFDGNCDSDCSLREAVQYANNTPGSDIIRLFSGTYTLTIPVTTFDAVADILDEDLNINGDLDVSDDLIIEGALDGTTIIDGSKTDRVLDIHSGSVQLIRLIVKNGQNTSPGGGINNHSDLTIRDSTVTGNTIFSWLRPGAGGGIANYGVLKIFRSTISHNYALSDDALAGQGGGIYNEGTLTVRDSTFSSNDVADVHDTASGGAIFSSGANAAADIRRSLFVQNNSGYDNDGAAVITVNGALMKITSSTFTDHLNNLFGLKGSVVANGSDGNYTPGRLAITHTTITNNGVFGLFTSGTTRINNSIIVGNAHPATGLAKNCRRLSGDLTTRGLLIGQEDTPSCFGDYNIENNLAFITLFEPLADNGGPTLTHAIKPNSLAVDNALGICPQFDQRGSPMPVDGNNDGYARCDLGAFELQRD